MNEDTKAWFDLATRLVAAYERHVEANVAVSTAAARRHDTDAARAAKLQALDERSVAATEEGVKVAAEMNDAVCVVVEAMRGIGPWLARVEQKLDCVTAQQAGESKEGQAKK